MIWVESAGGPLTVMDDAALSAWTGFEGDYQRACAVGSVGVVPVGDSAEALVLGDEPAGTSYLPAWRTFLQWLYADSGTDVPTILKTAFDGACWEAGPMFTVVGPLVLFDSALPGQHVVIENVDRPDVEPTNYERTEDALRIEIPVGRYRIESAEIQPDTSTCFRLLRFVHTS